MIERKKSEILIKLIVVFGFFFFSCNVNNTPGNNDSEQDQENKAEWHEESDGWIKFTTNSQADYSAGFKFWKNSQIDFKGDGYQVEVKKVTGSQEGRVGILFAFQDQENYYRLRVRINGSYAIEKRENDGLSSVKTGSLTDSQFNKGLNAVNRLKIVHNGSNQFNIYVNDHKIHAIVNPAFSSGAYGLYVGIGSASEENFPATPVEVRFNITHCENNI